jgi:hypothetical protein
MPNLADTTELDFDVTSSVPDAEPASGPGPAPTEEPPPPDSPSQPEPAAPVPATDEPVDDADTNGETDDKEPDLASEAGRELAKKRWRSHQHRINDLTAKRREAERQAQAERDRAERLERELAAHRPAPQAPPTPTPQPTDRFPGFDAWAQQPDNAGKDYEDFLGARARWEVRQELAAERERIAQDAATRDVMALHRTFAERTTQFRTTHADYDAAIGAVRDPISPLVQHAIMDSPHGPALLYYLATHEEDRQHVTASNPDARALRYLGKLESRFEAALPGPAKPPVSTTAKPPIKPVGGSPVSGDAPPDPDSEDLDAHIEFYNRQERARRR